ncbi:MAG TPA: sigma 54-interacting transcriptional regulator [Candidatus Sulfotelmatobacter sp.]|nr:sigma 54-interacting transcriptional regulator [Candidatus Sulfotelmatobacter sp.]
MQPRLFAISGPLKDSTLPLPEGDALLRPESSNALAVIDASIFRKSCRLRQVEGRFQILDLECRSGTTVNGKSVKEEWLHHGDEIAVGDSVFVFLLEDEHYKGTPLPARVEPSLLGEGVRMKEIHQFLMRVAPSDSTVLIEGESGTGKELAARALHRHSGRSSKPFVAINCAAIPDTLLEADLFGHERGSFTGAVVQKKGRLEVADGGVVFLDEIGELAPALQVKLLRVLQEREFERVGGTRPIKVDIRLIAATNCDLNQAVRAGRFRRDLYYRLAVVKLKMPSLRERKEDISQLAHHFVQKYARRCKVKAKPVSREAMACLTHHDWPGNVRELENAIEHALVLGHSDALLSQDLPESILEYGPAQKTNEGRYHSRVKALKKQLIVEAVERTRGNYVEAAGILGVHPNYLHRLIRNLDLKDFLKDALREETRSATGRFSRASSGAA